MLRALCKLCKEHTWSSFLQGGLCRWSKSKTEFSTAKTQPSNYNEGSSPAALCGRRPRCVSGSAATHHGQRLGRGLLPQPDPPLSSHRHLASTCAWGNPSACFQPSVSQFSLLARCISEAAAEPSAAFCAAQLGVPQRPFPSQVMKSAGFHSALTTSISFSPVPRHTSGFSAGRICLVSHYPACRASGSQWAWRCLIPIPGERTRQCRARLCSVRGCDSQPLLSPLCM